MACSCRLAARGSRSRRCRSWGCGTRLQGFALCTHAHHSVLICERPTRACRSVSLYAMHVCMHVCISHGSSASQLGSSAQLRMRMSAHDHMCHCEQGQTSSYWSQHAGWTQGTPRSSAVGAPRGAAHTAAHAVCGPPDQQAAGSHGRRDGTNAGMMLRITSPYQAHGAGALVQVLGCATAADWHRARNGQRVGRCR